MGKPEVVGYVGVTLNTAHPKPIYRPREYRARSGKGTFIGSTWLITHHRCGYSWYTDKGPHDSARLHAARYCTHYNS